MAVTESAVAELPPVTTDEHQLVSDFRGTGEAPVQFTSKYAILRSPSFKFRQLVAKSYKPAILADPFVASFHVPSPDKSGRHSYFCEACAMQIPACQEDWAMHIAGVLHKWHLLSLHDTRELLHKLADTSMLLCAFYGAAADDAAAVNLPCQQT